VDDLIKRVQILSEQKLLVSIDDNVIMDRNKSTNSNNHDKFSSNFEEVCPWKSKPFPPVDLLKGLKWEGETWYFCPKCLTGIWVTTHDVNSHTEALELVELEKMKICNFDFYKRCMWISGWLYTYKGKGACLSRARKNENL